MTREERGTLGSYNRCACYMSNWFGTKTERLAALPGKKRHAAAPTWRMQRGQRNPRLIFMQESEWTRKSLRPRSRRVNAATFPAARPASRQCGKNQLHPLAKRFRSVWYEEYSGAAIEATIRARFPCCVNQLPKIVKQMHDCSLYTSLVASASSSSSFWHILNFCQVSNVAC